MITGTWETFVERVDPGLREPLMALAAAIPPEFRSLPVSRRRELAEAAMPQIDDRPDVVWSDCLIPGGDGPDVPVRVYRPVRVHDLAPAVLFIHGGGMWAGSVRSDHAACADLAVVVDAVVVSVDYRCAPESPYPAALLDCLAALRWLHGDDLGTAMDRTRVCVMGPSAGGGLAIATTMAARREALPVAALMAIYPMIDDRGTTPSAREFHGLGPAVWDREANAEAWDWYLGGAVADELAAPARATDLAGMPPTFIDVGTLDLFRDEDVAFAARLLEAGVPVELHVHPGAFHGGEAVAPDAPLSRRIVETRHAALRRFLHPASVTEAER